MKSDIKIQHSSHITMGELKEASTFDADNLNPAESAKMMELYEKIEECSVCQMRYRYFLDSEAILVALQAMTPKAIFSVADILADKLASLDTKIQSKIEAWLESAQNLLNSLDKSSFQSTSANSMWGTRSLITSFTSFNDEKLEKNILDINLKKNPSDGCFDFELTVKTDVKFKVPKETDDGSPICLVITGRNETEYSEIYPLTTRDLPDFSQSLSSQAISLEAGEYTLCVPTLEEE